jgi:hypothetical protein
LLGHVTIRWEARWREETAGVLLTTHRSHADGSTTSRRSKSRRDTYRRSRTCGRGRRTDAARQEGTRPGSPSPPRHQTLPGPSHPTSPPPVWLRGWEGVVCAAQGALVGALRERIRKCCRVHPTRRQAQMRPSIGCCPDQDTRAGKLGHPQEAPGLVVDHTHQAHRLGRRHLPPCPIKEVASLVHSWCSGPPRGCGQERRVPRERQYRATPCPGNTLRALRIWMTSTSPRDRREDD